VINQRRLGGILLALGALLVLIGLGSIAVDLWPDGEITAASFLIDVVVFILPGLVAIGAGATIGRNRPGR